MTEATAHAEKLEFKTELKQLLHIITHSLYSHRENFLRELISNASDAINKIKFDSLAHEDVLENNKDWKIKIIPDPEKGTLTVSDNGIGMSREGVIDQLGTIAKSGTRAFLEQLRNQQVADRPDLIGQFGVGFYSAFMVADRVTVVTRPAGDPKQGVRWESDGQGAQEYKVLLFVPSHRPFDMDWGETKVGPRLYVQRVLIMDHCEELLPPYLRFVKGVVDSSDLPLNISRELLQQNPLLAKMRDEIVRSVLKDLAAMKEDEHDKYVAFFQALGDILKEGVGRDWNNRERVADLLLF